METLIIKGSESNDENTIINNLPEISVLYISDWGDLESLTNLSFTLKYIIVGGYYKPNNPKEHMEKIESFVNRNVRIPYGCKVIYLEEHPIMELNNRKKHCLKITEELKPYFKFGKVKFLRDNQFQLPNHLYGREYHIYHTPDMEKLFVI